MLNNDNHPLSRYRSLCDLRSHQQNQLAPLSVFKLNTNNNSNSNHNKDSPGSIQTLNKRLQSSKSTLSLSCSPSSQATNGTTNIKRKIPVPINRLSYGRHHVSTTNLLGKGINDHTNNNNANINRKRFSCENLNVINRAQSLSVINLNCLNGITASSNTAISGSTITLSNPNNNNSHHNGNNENTITNKRGLSLEPCCLCCTPRTKLTKTASTTNLRYQRNRCNNNQKLDDSRKNSNSLKDDDESIQCYVPSQELYKKLVKENLQLQSSFKVVCQRLDEEKERSVTDSLEKQTLQDQVDNLKRKVDLLALELQEARDQNELMEFRILESEQTKVTYSETPNLAKCDKAIQLESTRVHGNGANSNNNLIMTAPRNGMASMKIKSDCLTANQLFHFGLAGKQSCSSTSSSPPLLTTSTTTVVIAGSPPTKSNKSTSSLESYALTLSLTSEDEGLGDDGRRDQFSGPSSLSDLHLSDEESSGSSRSSNGGEESGKCSEIGIQTSNLFEGLINTGPCQYCKESNNLEAKLNLLMEERDTLQEQVLELEEAENDARLVSQRLQRQVENLVNQVDCLQISLVKANQQIDQCNETIRSLRECELKLKVDFMMALIAKSEDSPSKLLDELKAKLKEKKHELASMGPMVFSSLNTFEDRSIDSSETDNRHHFQQTIYQQPKPKHPQSQHPHQSLSQSANQSRSQFYQQQAANQSYLQFSLNDAPDDCEIFVPEDSLPPNPGSSFHVQMLDSSRFSNHRPTSSFKPSASPNNQSPPSTSRSPLPLCETVKAKKIDLLLPSPSSSYSSPSLSPSSSTSSPLVSPSLSSASSTSSNSSSLSP